MLNIIHGANPENLFRAFNIPIPPEILDFSTNTNILTWPDVSLNMQHLASHYPDPECSRLRELIAEREHVPPSRILFTNGTNEAIFLLAGLFPENTAILEPAYPEYARAFTNLHRVFSLEEALSFSQIIIVNPNNPTGKYLHLAEFIRAHPQNIFIVDEAYIDFLLRKKPERLCDFPNVIILRSLTKIFHLSGARIGYVIAGDEIISALKKRQPSWSVNAFAQELAAEFLGDEGFLRRTRDFYSRETPAFMNMLREAGCEVIDSDVHFFLVRVRDDEAVIRHLLTNGIAVRHTRNFAGLGGKYIRIAARLPDDNRKFADTVKNLVRV
ncbi:MAG: pyridoxal phosphate-dependent class II aminotransferase [Synergistaceae bacterium]|nr:pyridoxal phosphate-dependent class II aminotransferase [Synergistaceae bacterium]